MVTPFSLDRAILTAKLPQPQLSQEPKVIMLDKNFSNLELIAIFFLLKDNLSSLIDSEAWLDSVLLGDEDKGAE